jgi:hypothetical protein
LLAVFPLFYVPDKLLPKYSGVENVSPVAGFSWPLNQGVATIFCNYKYTWLGVNLLIRYLAVTESGRHVESKPCSQFTPDLRPVSLSRLNLPIAREV